MKIMQFVISTVLSCVLVCGVAQPMDVAEPKVSSAQKKKQWSYVQDSLKATVVDAQGTMRIIEKVLKYGVAPGVPLLFILSHVWFEKLTILNDFEEGHHATIAKVLNFLKETEKSAQDWAACDFVVCCTAFAVSAVIYALTNAAFSSILKTQSHDAFKNLLAEWHKYPNRIPQPLQQMVEKLYKDARADTLTKEQSAQAVAGLLAMSSVALAE